MRACTVTCVVSYFICAVVFPSGAHCDQSSWPQWRGPDSQGVSTETGLALEWSRTKNVDWVAAIPGNGHSSPIIFGNRIFLTTAIEGTVIPGATAVRHVTKDGKEFLHPDSIGADRFQTLKVLCLDLKTGKFLWER